jgi:hypothetical protein
MTTAIARPLTCDTGTRLAGYAALLAFVTFNVGWLAGDLAQPRSFSPLHDDISDLGAQTATSAWLYNQLAANLSGLLLIGLAVGLWRILATGRLGRLGVLTVTAVGAAGLGTFLDGVFRLDCQGIDVGCRNDSWHSHAHKIESAVTVVAVLLSVLLLPFVLRRLGNTAAQWLPLLGAVPALLAANVAFSALGDGAATRAGTLVLFLSFAYVGYRLVRLDDVQVGPLRR